MLEHTVHELSVLFWSNQCIEGMCGTESVPKREGGIVILAFRHPLCAIVGSGVVAAYVAEYVRLYHRVIEGGVEFLHIILLAFHLDAPQELVPLLVGDVLVLLKVPTFGFRTHIGTCVFHGSRRKGNLADERFLILRSIRRVVVFNIAKIEETFQFRAVDERSVFLLSLSIYQDVGSDRLGQFDMEIHTT